MKRSLLKKRTKKLLRIGGGLDQRPPQGIKVFASFFKKKCFLLAFLVFLPAAAQAEMPLATLYTLHCSGCHGAGGHGVPSAGIPDLSYAASYLAVPQGRAYLIQVPGISQSRLDDATAAAMLNYVLARFSAADLPRDFVPYTSNEIHRLRANAASDAETQRAAIFAGLRKLGRLPVDHTGSQY